MAEFRVGAKVEDRVLRFKSGRKQHGRGRITRVWPGSRYGRWPYYIDVRWDDDGKTTGRMVDHVELVADTVEVNISRCPGLIKALAHPEIGKGVAVGNEFPNGEPYERS